MEARLREPKTLATLNRCGTSWPYLISARITQTPAQSFLPFILYSEVSMALFKLPLSGDVVQWINPVTWFASGNQITANVYLGESSSPETEAEILDRVGTYGRQLGQITDAIVVLLRHVPHREILTPEESKVIKAFEKMANDIADIKAKHQLQAVRP
jgi:hypothetical protein